MNRQSSNKTLQSIQLLLTIIPVKTEKAFTGLIQDSSHRPVSPPLARDSGRTAHHGAKIIGTETAQTCLDTGSPVHVATAHFLITLLVTTAQCRLLKAPRPLHCHDCYVRHIPSIAGDQASCPLHHPAPPPI